jgi:uncharacterized protein
MIIDPFANLHSDTVTVVERLVAALSPERILLFGSWARGEASADSDLDLLVVVDSDEPMYKRMAHAQRALRGMSVPVDVFVVTPEEVARYRDWRSHTIAIALREGRELCAA